MIDTNCPNCGAIITGPKCEYCGTEFRHDDSINVSFNIAECTKAYEMGLMTPNEIRRCMLQEERNTEIINSLSGMKWGLKRERRII